MKSISKIRHVININIFFIFLYFSKIKKKSNYIFLVFSLLCVFLKEINFAFFFITQNKCNKLALDLK